MLLTNDYIIIKLQCIRLLSEPNNLAANRASCGVPGD